MEKIKVSVIVPIYNCEEYLEECIKSIINQTLSEIEIILIDDGSIDKSLEICNRYRKIDERIKVIHQENQGVSKSRENGLNEAKGEYISFIDADDYIKEDFLNILLNLMEENNSDIVCCNSIDLESKNSFKNSRIQKNILVERKDKLYMDFFDLKRYMCTIWGKLIKKELIKKCYFTNQKYSEDTHLMLELVYRAKKVYLSIYDGYYYRYNKNSVTQKTLITKKYEDILKTDEYCYKLVSTIDNKLKFYATNKIAEDLYGAIISYSLYGNENLFNSFINKFNNTYKIIKNNKKKMKIKNLIIYLFYKNSRKCKNFLKIVYVIIGKYNKNKINY